MEVSVGGLPGTGSGQRLGSVIFPFLGNGIDDHEQIGVGEQECVAVTLGDDIARHEIRERGLAERELDCFGRRRCVVCVALMLRRLREECQDVVVLWIVLVHLVSNVP
jgi:hypothetical protein